MPRQLLGRFLGIKLRLTGWDPSVCKSNRLHVDILRFSFVELGYILYIPLNWLVIFLQSSTSTGYFSNSTGASVTNCRFSPNIVPRQKVYTSVGWIHFGGVLESRPEQNKPFPKLAWLTMFIRLRGMWVLRPRAKSRDHEIVRAQNKVA